VTERIGAARLTIVEVQPGSVRRTTHTQHVAPHTTPLRIGRGCGISLGVDPLDRKVSGLAKTVEHDGHAWLITSTNRHGIDELQWGRPWRRLDTGATERVRWPRVALQVRGEQSLGPHWVLLEDAAMPIGWIAPPRDTDTDQVSTDDKLTDVEEARTRAAFAHLLAWPPVPRDTPAPTYAAVARRQPPVARVDEEGRTVMVPLSESALRKSLDGARAKAGRLGPIGGSARDPDWVFTLVQYGLLLP